MSEKLQILKMIFYMFIRSWKWEHVVLWNEINMIMKSIEIN